MHRVLEHVVQVFALGGAWRQLGDTVLWKRALDESGDVIVAVTDGREAVGLAAWCAPDMLLFDINMPHLDGIEACEVIFKRQGGRRLPVWFVTGDYEHFPRGRAEAVGARGLLIKPFNSYEIRDAVQSVLAEAAAA